MLGVALHRSLGARSKITVLVRALSLCALSACGNPFAGECSLVSSYGIIVTVTDSVTSQALPTRATVQFIDGEYVSESQLPSQDAPTEYAGAYARPGIYEVVVRANGFVERRFANVRVGTTGRCNKVSTVRVNARLVPST